jgi:adenylate kinase
MLAIITGIPGTGKTTVAKKAMEILGKKGVSYKFINYGDVMFGIAKEEKNLVKDRDEMRKLKPEQQKEIQIMAAEKISKMTRDERVLLDTHCTISTPKGFLPGIPEYVLRELNPDLLIIIEAKIEEIYQRRQGDETRRRDEELFEEIQLHQELNRSIAMAYSTLTGATIKIIKNPQDKVDEAVRELIKILK